MVDHVIPGSDASLWYFNKQNVSKITWIELQNQYPVFFFFSDNVLISIITLEFWQGKKESYIKALVPLKMLNIKLIKAEDLIPGQNTGKPHGKMATARCVTKQQVGILYFLTGIFNVMDI